MSKSKYPQQLDTSIEIPAVRDNITEISSDVINSIRSAIIQIEHTLGINPQGATGNNVSSRLSRSLDDNGNILSSALDRANVLSGPIIDVDVSRVAGIQESKLKLDFPTTLLQDEISIINKDLENILSALEELSVTLAIHLEPTAINRHSALAISVSSSDIIASDTASLSLIAGTLQETLEIIYNSHINYSGSNISAINNSHLASQISFDNVNTSDIIFSGSVQGAIDDLAAVESVGFRNALLNLHSNGRIRKGSTTDGFEGNQIGTELLPISSATYIQSSGLSRTVFSLDFPVEVYEEILEYDLLTLSGSLNNDDNKNYQVSSVILNGLNQVVSIEVYGGPVSPSSSGLLILVSKNINVSYNESGFVGVVRPRSNKSNTPDVQIANPDSATLMSFGIRSESIIATSHTFDISVDGGSAITIDTYDSTVSKQTIDSIINKVNEQFVDQHLNVMAYKSRSRNCFEMAIIHNVPNFTGDIINRTIKVSVGSINDGTSILGLTNILDLEAEGSTGNSLHINGLILSEFGLIKQFTESTIELITGALVLSLFSGTFSENGIRVGDIVVIDGSSEPTDDGSYRVGSIAGDTASLDLSGGLFLGSLESNSQVLIIRSTAPIGELTFTEILSVNGTLLFDIFINEEKDIHYTKRVEVDGLLLDGPFSATIKDISKNFIIREQTASLSVSLSGMATLTDPSLLTGTPVFVAATGIYKIYAADGMSFIILEVNATGAPITDQLVTIYGFNEVNKGNYLVCRGGFSTALGRVLGESTDPGIPVLLDKRSSGTADATIVGESFIEKYIEGPRNELRASGVIRGCEVSGATYLAGVQTFDVSAGIIVVNGIRYEFPGLESFKIETTNNYYVAIDSLGCVVAEPITVHPVTGDPVSPFFDQEVATLSFVTNDTINAIEIDLRLFIDNLDLKFISDIMVSPDQRFGHFTDIKKAVDYSRRFIEMFPYINSPSVFIKEGEYTVNEQILLDFDVTIRGVGENSIITKIGAFAIGGVLSGDNVDMSTAAFLIGGGQNSDSISIVNGVTIKDLLYKTSSSLLNVGCFIALTQGTSPSSNNNFLFKNIHMIGPSNINGATSIGEYFIVVGKQDSITLLPAANTRTGNMIISNCVLRRVGLEYGAVKILESSGGVFSDVIVNSNIAINASPNIGNSDNEIIEYPTTTTMSSIIESSNSVDTSAG
jgi:hypothetical protein